MKTREHAGHRPRRVGVDRDDARMRIRRAQEGDRRRAGAGDVVGEAAAAGEQRVVLDAGTARPLPKREGVSFALLGMGGVVFLEAA